MSEKRFTLDDDENGLCRCILVDGEEYFSKEISMNLIFNTYDDGFIEESIEMMIWEVLNDKAFDGLGWFEKNDGSN